MPKNNKNKNSLLPILSKDNLPEIISTFTDTSIKVIEKLDLLKNDSWLGDIPFGKLLGFFVKKLVKIEDVDKALQQAVAKSYFYTFLNAVQANNLSPQITAEELLHTYRLIQNYYAKQPTKAALFDINDYLENEVVQNYQLPVYYLMQHSDLSAGQQTAVEQYMAVWAKHDFLKLIEESEIVFDKFRKYLKSDSYAEMREVLKKEAYKNRLKNQYCEPVWGDEQGMRLVDIYVEPHFEVHSYCFDKGDSRVGHRSDNFVKVDYPPKSLHYFVDDWLHRKKPLALQSEKSNILFLFGYPGQGKTSFCKRLLFDTYTGDKALSKPLHFIRLRDISAVGDLLKNPTNVLKEHIDDERDTKEKLSKKQFMRSIWLLDGLDELHQQNNLPQTSIENFCLDLIELAANHDELQIIVTSRFGYIDLKRLKKEEALLLQLQTFSLEQQLQWLNNYQRFYPNCKLSAEKLQSIHEGFDKKYKRLQELTNQPILLQMVASSNYLIDEDAHITDIYSQLFSIVINRKWAKNKLRKIKGLQPSVLHAFLQDIAFEIFQSPNEYLHKSQIEQLPYIKRFKAQLQEGNLNSVLKGLMLAFYMKEVPRHAEDLLPQEEKNYDYAIEFLHKSLQEYLTAEKIWRDLKKIFLEQKEEYGFVEYRLQDGLPFLRELSKLFAAKRLSEEIMGYLIEIIQKDTDVKQKEDLIERLHKNMPFLIQHDYLYSYEASQKSATSPITQSMNVFYGHWMVLMHLKEESDNYLDFGEENVKKRWVYLLRCMVSETSPPFLNLAKQKLIEAKLAGADLRSADLRSAYLRSANLRSADLSRADLRSANLSRADLSRADLRSADLSSADLRSADLRSADLRSAYLRSAYLRSAYLRSADLRSADLSSADLSSADLSSADLSSADLRSADLRSADLRSANLSSADLSSADLSSADLSSADLRSADLSSADLRSADLRSANLEGTKNLTIEQLLQAKSLYQCKGLSEEWVAELKEKKPELFEEPKYELDLGDFDFGEDELDLEVLDLEDIDFDELDFDDIDLDDL